MAVAGLPNSDGDFQHGLNRLVRRSKRQRCLMVMGETGRTMASNGRGNGC